MVERTVILTVVVSVEAAVFLGLLVVLIVVYKFLRPGERSTHRSSVNEQMITVQERGNSIYRDSTYSGNLSMFGRQSLNRGLFGRYSFSRGTETFKRHQQSGLNNQKEQDQPLKEPSQSSLETIELQSLQHNESPVVEQGEAVNQVETHPSAVDENTD